MAEIVIIVFLIVVGSVLHAVINRRPKAPAIDDARTKALEAQVETLRDRVKVLERIAIESDNTLARQIEELRDA